MAELTQQERLQPSLLDRLTDESPTVAAESRQARVLSLRRLREAVRRDLAWLLNTCSLDATEDLDDYPEVRQSVVNYGMPDLTGRAVSDLEIGEVERVVRDAVRRFEPRLLPETLQVRVKTNEAAMSHNAMTFDIEAQLWAQPQPTRLYLRTALDLETGDVTVNDLGG